MPRIILLLFAVILVLLAAGCIREQATPVADETIDASGHEVMVLLVNNMTRDTLDALSGLDQATSDAAIALGTTGLSGHEAEAALMQVKSSGPSVLTVITMDRDGTVVSAVPEDAEILIGENLGDQAVVRQVLSTREPLMSDLVPLAQGGYAVLIQYPVFSSGGNFSGLVSTAFQPWDLIAPVAENTGKGTPYTFMVAETDGTILYDPDPGEIGKETFNETLYADFPGILDFARQYSGNISGYATYSYYNTGFGKIVEKEAFWTTIGVHGTDWRIIVIGEV